MREERLFKIASEFAPMGDQPQAIETLAKGVLEGKNTSDPNGRHRFGEDLSPWPTS